MEPSNEYGAVLGGETIKSINQQTGAHCEVDRNAPPDARDKNFVIRGTPEQVERAKQMIARHISERTEHVFRHTRYTSHIVVRVRRQAL